MTTSLGLGRRGDDAADEPIFTTISEAEFGQDFARMLSGDRRRCAGRGRRAAESRRGACISQLPGNRMRQRAKQLVVIDLRVLMQLGQLARASERYVFGSKAQRSI